MKQEEPSDELNDLSYKVIGAAMEVHKVLGPGLLESVYEEAMCIELRRMGLPYEKQKEVGVVYKGEMIGTGRLDILVDRQIIVELKAVEEIIPVHEAQVLTYLKVTGKKFGLLINFNVPILKKGIKRIAL